jgi:hypothetical protein
MDPKLLEALLAAELNTEEVRAERNRDYALRIRQQDYREKALDEAADASGAAQIGGTILTSGMLLKDTKIGQAISAGVGKAATGGMNLVKGIVSPEKAVAGVAPTPAVTTTGTGIGESAVAGGAAGALTAKGMTQMAVGSEIAHLAAAGEGALAAGVAEGSIASGAGAELAYGAGEAVTGGMTAGSIAAAGAGMFGGAAIGRLGANILFPGNSTAADIGTIGGGAVAGFMVGGPVGAVIGAAVGVVTDLVSDASVICTELYYQGYLSAETLLLDEIHGRDEIDYETYAGYHKWAIPLVGLMQKSKIITQIVRPFGVAWANEMASRVDTS